ncbi:hypothetical protein BUALT_Bualt12G0061400 [Buddleja alternifolia]|uniref:4-coumarate--CoA ligase n=1 Tax=Buddleja alternifolia TaxID=168488 RepID=A0AAV6WWB9_9LAMI|nr:hypothetical protein BUALT_Bualt12G0061400 [Buddleja alternifolia]
MELKEEKEHIFHSKLPDIYIPSHLPTHTYCFQNLSNHRSRPALINSATGEVFTHGDVHLTARRVAAGLHNLGIRKGHVIMLLLHNSPEFAFTFLAASFIGAATTTANPFYTAEEITTQAQISKPKLIITHSIYVDKVKRFASQNGARIVSIDPSPSLQSQILIHFSDLKNSDEKSLPEIQIQADDTAALPFSSGTTGLPKGVMLSHKNLVTCVSQQVDGDNPAFHINGQDLTLCVLPMFHVFSLITVLLCNIRVGAAVLIMQKFEINELMKLVEKNRVTIAPFVPPILLAIAKSPEAAAAEKYDLSSVRRVLCGAAPMDKKLESSVRAKLPNATIGQVINC